MPKAPTSSSCRPTAPTSIPSNRSSPSSSIPSGRLSRVTSTPPGERSANSSTSSGRRQAADNQPARLTPHGVPTYSARSSRTTKYGHGPRRSLSGGHYTHINEISFQPPQTRRAMIRRTKRLALNSSRAGCAVGGKSNHHQIRAPPGVFAGRLLPSDPFGGLKDKPAEGREADAPEKRHHDGLTRSPLSPFVGRSSEALASYYPNRFEFKNLFQGTICKIIPSFWSQ